MMDRRLLYVVPEPPPLAEDSRLRDELRTVRRIRYALIAAAVIVGALCLGGCHKAEPTPTDALASFAAPDDASGGVHVIHDRDRMVTCWVYVGWKKGGISCLPDWQLTTPIDLPDLGTRPKVRRAP